MKRALVVIGYKTINYGSALQAIATQKMLEKENINVDIANIDILWNTFRKKKALFYLRNFQIGYLIKSKGKMFLSKAVRLVNRDYRLAYNKRSELFEKCLHSNLNLTRPIKDFNDAREISKAYDFVIIGSDQVWLPSSVLTDIYTLKFAWGLNGVQTMSYAPSFGIDYILPQYRKTYKNMFKNIDHLSVREEVGKRLIEELSEKQIALVADPVLMLDKEAWLSIFPDEEADEKNYIFVYLIGNNSEHRKRIIEFAKKKNLTTVAFVHLDEYIGRDEKIYDYHYISSRPENFINYIRHAQYVFTDSYHCLLMALIYNKPLGIFMRFKEGSKISTNNRIYSILEKLKVGKGVLHQNEAIEESNLICNYDNIDGQIEEFRNVSYKFINHAINGEEYNESTGKYCNSSL